MNVYFQGGKEKMSLSVSWLPLFFSLEQLFSVCVVLRKMFVAMEIEGAFSPRYKGWDGAEQREIPGFGICVGVTLGGLSPGFV